MPRNGVGPARSPRRSDVCPFIPGQHQLTLFQVRGFRNNYQPSASLSNLFSTASFVPNNISFGFASGEASSDFVASPGQTFYAPVTLTTLPGTVMYSLQFNVTVNNAGPNPGPALGGPPAPFGFQSMLMQPIPGSPAGICAHPAGNVCQRRLHQFDVHKSH